MFSATTCSWLRATGLRSSEVNSSNRFAGACGVAPGELDALQNEGDFTRLGCGNRFEALTLPIGRLGASRGRGALGTQDRARLHRARELLRVRGGNTEQGGDQQQGTRSCNGP